MNISITIFLVILFVLSSISYLCTFAFDYDRMDESESDKWWGIYKDVKKTVMTLSTYSTVITAFVLSLPVIYQRIIISIFLFALIIIIACIIYLSNIQMIQMTNTPTNVTSASASYTTAQKTASSTTAQKTASNQNKK